MIYLHTHTIGMEGIGIVGKDDVDDSENVI